MRDKLNEIENLITILIRDETDSLLRANRALNKEINELNSALAEKVQIADYWRGEAAATILRYRLAALEALL